MRDEHAAIASGCNTSRTLDWRLMKVQWSGVAPGQISHLPDLRRIIGVGAKKIIIRGKDGAMLLFGPFDLFVVGRCQKASIFSGRNFDPKQQRWQTFVNTFGIAKPGANPWNARLLDDNFAAASAGERFVIQFLLNLWNSQLDWQCGSFDSLEALAVWQGGPFHVAYLKWAESPWWP